MIFQNKKSIFNQQLSNGQPTVHTSTLEISDTTESTSCTTGALVVDGGVGIAKNLNVCGQTTITDNTRLADGSNTITSTSGALNVNGDVVLYNETTGENGRIIFGDDQSGAPADSNNRNDGYKIIFNPNPTTTHDCALGFNVGGDLWFQNITSGSFSWYGNTDEKMKIELGQTNSTSSSTGRLILTTGGIGCGADSYFDGKLTIADTTESTSISTGALIVSGGVGITKNLYVGGTIKIDNSTGAILQFRDDLSSDTYQIEYDNQGGNGSNLHLRIVGASDSGTQRDIDIGYYTSDSSANAWNSVWKVSSQSGLLVSVGINNITNTTESTTTSNGALVVSGGVGVAKRMNVGDELQVTNAIVNHRNFVDKTSIDAVVGYSAAEMIGTYIKRSTTSGSYSDTFPTAAAIVSAIDNCAVGTTFSTFLYVSALAGTLSLLASGSPSVTIKNETDSNLTLVAGNTYRLDWFVDNVTASSESVIVNVVEYS